jgi:hypothetical protein
MVRVKSLPLAATVLLAGVLSACTSFAPVYGDRSGAGMESVRFNFASPDSRLEQIVLDRLKLAFPGAPSPTDPVLDIAVITRAQPGAMSDAFDVARPMNIRVEAAVTISRGDEAVFQADRFADTAYQGGRLVPVNLESKANAEETAARSVAEMLRVAILASYRL